MAYTALPYRRAVKTIYTVSQKALVNVNLFFQNSFTVRFRRKFVTKSYLNTPPHAKRVATLSSEILVCVFKIRNS